MGLAGGPVGGGLWFRPHRTDRGGTVGDKGWILWLIVVAGLWLFAFFALDIIFI